MSDTLNERIALLIEPKPSVDDLQLHDLSPKNAWCCEWRVNAESGVHSLDWQPRAFDSDPACTVMLLERESFVSLDLDEGIYRATFCGTTVHTVACYDLIKSVEHEDLNAAVAIAFLKAHEPSPSRS